MSSVLRFVQVFALGTWVGSIIYLSFVVAPAAFGVLQSRDQPGLMVGYSLARLHYLGCIRGSAVFGGGLGVGAVAEGLCAAGDAGRGVDVGAYRDIADACDHRALAELRTEMVSVDATPKDNPLRVEFDRLHQTSVRIEVAVLVMGIAALFSRCGACRSNA